MPEKASTGTGVIGADTSFLVDFFKGEEGAVSFMDRHARLLRVSELVIYEFLCGNLTEDQKKIFFGAVQSFATVSFNREAALLASELFGNARKKGRTAGHQDCMIAGSYLAFGVRTIVTRKKKHFAHLPDVSVVTY